MYIVGAHPDGETELELELSDDTKIKDLAAAVFGETLSADTGGALVVDGTPVDGEIPVAESGLGAGAVLQLLPLGLAQPVPTRSKAAVRFAVLSGPGAGLTLDLTVGTYVIGSGKDVHIALRVAGVKPRHGVLEVRGNGDVLVAGPEPMAPRRQLFPDAMLTIGSAVVTCQPLRGRTQHRNHMPGRRGTVAFNRPPRDVRVSTELPVALPEKPKPPSKRGPMSIVMLITPVVFGLAMAFLIHPRMALFALLAPLTFVGHKWDDKRKAKKFKRESAIENAENAEHLAEELDGRRAREAVRRRTTNVPVPQLADRCVAGHTELWERRRYHDDFMQLVCGYGYDQWLPLFDRDPLTVADELIATMRTHSALPLAPVTVDLAAGQVIGLSGDRGRLLDLARGLVVQAVALHGPSDLQLAIVTERPDDWDWTKWLPHTVLDSAAGRRMLASEAADVMHIVSTLMPKKPDTGGGSGGGLLGGGGGGSSKPSNANPDEPTTLLIVDVDDLAAARYAGVRHLLGGRGSPVAGLAIAPNEHALPSVCTRTVMVTNRSAELRGGPQGDLAIAPAGAVEQVARTAARALARYDDPDRSEDGAELPGRVDLVDLIDFHERDPQIIIDRWQKAGKKPRPKGPIGVTEAGPLELDFISDGPHGLLAGTTGSGKSELLRTMVAGLAASVDPEHLTFVLIDYKGGSAFDACAGLPHTVGMVTDLDDHLAERALTCLEAELRYREHFLRDAGADDLPAYLDLGLDEPLPRMLIVIDEFAAMAKELPDFMDALVDIAARGRSLGVHLVLATQRPAGVIRDNVRANTNMRIALRVQDRGDSMDVLNDRRAATIGRTQPGRGFLRLGPTEVVPFQTALVTGRVFGSAEGSSHVPIRPFGFSVDPPSYPKSDAVADDEAPTDLEILVEVVAEAAEIAGMRPPRLPWPETLPDAIRRAEMATDVALEPGSIALGMQDEPDYQRQTPFAWSPKSGSLVAYGNVGTGTTTTLASIALGLAETHSPEDLHIYVLDFDTGGLAPLEALPHVGGVVIPGERERQIRLIRQLNKEVSERKAGPAVLDGGTPRPTIIVMIDGFDGFKTEYDIGLDSAIRDALSRIVTEGPSVDIVPVITGMRANSLLPQMAATVPTKLVFRMADPLAAGGLGLRGIPTDLGAGRCFDVLSKREIQIAMPSHDDLALSVAELGLDPWVGNGGPRAIENLPTEVKVSALTESIRIVGDEWFVPVGIGDTNLDVVGLALGEGDHILIAGEPRSGRSTMLASIATLVAGAADTVTITAIAPRRSPLREIAEIDLLITDPDEVDTRLEGIGEAEGLQLILVDDADMIEKSDVLTALSANRRGDLHVIATGRRDLKRQYNHWANALTKSRKGLWLQPSPGLDGDLWSTPMPRYIPTGMPQGRGYLLSDGVVELVQTAKP